MQSFYNPHFLIFVQRKIQSILSKQWYIFASVQTSPRLYAFFHSRVDSFSCGNLCKIAIRYDSIIKNAYDNYIPALHVPRHEKEEYCRIWCCPFRIDVALATRVSYLDFGPFSRLLKRTEVTKQHVELTVRSLRFASVVAKHEHHDSRMVGRAQDDQADWVDPPFLLQSYKDVCLRLQRPPSDSNIALLPARTLAVDQLPRLWLGCRYYLVGRKITPVF